MHHQASTLQIATLAWVFTCAVGGHRYGDDEPMAMYIGKRLFGTFISISVLICMYKCCCGEDSDAKPSEDAEQPPVSNQDGGEESNQLHPPNKPTVPSYNTCPPNPPSYHSPAFSKVVVHMKNSSPPVTVPYPKNPVPVVSPARSPARSPRASSPFRFPQGPAADDGPRFEPKELQNVQLPLSSDSTTCDVYTSSKLNFL